MVDTTQAMESQFVTVQAVKDSQSKRLVVISGGTYEAGQDGTQRLSLMVEMDGKRKTWRPNRNTVKNLQAYGKDSEQWVGKPIRLMVMTINNRELVIGTPAEGVPPVGGTDELDNIMSQLEE